MVLKSDFEKGIKMEFKIKKEGSEKYISIEKVKENENNYQLEMVSNNQIKGLLNIKIQYINNEKEILYDITSMNSLSKIFERKLMKKEDLIRFVVSIKRLSESLKEYLLCSDNIIFDSEYIFYDKQRDEYLFCYCPEANDDVELQLKILFNQLLDYIDHNNRETVELAYGLQQITSQDSFSIDQLQEFVLQKKEMEIKTDIDLDDDTLDYDDEEETIEKPKTSLFNKLKKLFTKQEKENDLTFEKSDYEYEENYFEDINEENHENGFMTDNLTDEDATVLLINPELNIIKLKSVSYDPEINIIVDKYPFVVGKSKRSSDYRINRNVISRVHARFNKEGDTYYIEDLNSTNGTFLNDEKLRPHENNKIISGDIIKLADLEFEAEC